MNYYLVGGIVLVIIIVLFMLYFLLKEQTTPATTPETTPVTTPETTPATTPETTPVTTPETTPVTTPETTPATTPETTPATTPETTPATALETTPATTPETTPATTNIIMWSDGVMLPSYNSSFGVQYWNKKTLEECYNECNENKKCVGANFDPDPCNTVTDKTIGMCHQISSYRGVVPTRETCKRMYFTKKNAKPILDPTDWRCYTSPTNISTVPLKIENDRIYCISGEKEICTRQETHQKCNDLTRTLNFDQDFREKYFTDNKKETAICNNNCKTLISSLL
jgi:hypothetical protein